MTKKGRPRQAHVWAEQILATLELHPGGLPLHRILELADITSGQYRRAYNWTLDTFGEPFWAKTYIGREVIYFTTENAPACNEDWARTINTQITRGRREHSKAHAFAVAHPGLASEEQELMAKHRLEALQMAKRKFAEVS